MSRLNIKQQSVNQTWSKLSAKQTKCQIRWKPAWTEAIPLILFRSYTQVNQISALSKQNLGFRRFLLGLYMFYCISVCGVGITWFLMWVYIIKGSVLWSFIYSFICYTGVYQCTTCFGLYLQFLLLYCHWSGLISYISPKIVRHHSTTFEYINTWYNN